MTTDDPHKRARELADSRYPMPGNAAARIAYICEYLAHAAQQPSRGVEQESRPVSALTEKMAREHRITRQGRHIVCACDEAYATPKDHAEHLAYVTEAAVRAQIAADIAELAHTTQQVKAHVASGGSAEECDGYDRAVVVATRIAEGTRQ